MPDLRTDYERIAGSYDEDRRRWQHVPPDEHIAVVPKSAAVLDLACGTGTFLRAQSEAFPDVRLFGMDLSPSMLGHAVGKGSGARFLRGRAEALPFPDASFAYVNSGYAFHHFVDKDAALAEVVRVLGPHGRFRIVNVEPRRRTLRGRPCALACAGRRLAGRQSGRLAHPHRVETLSSPNWNVGSSP